MNRINILNDVKTYLGRFTQEVRNHTESSTFDINIHAETVLIPLLNKTYTINLQNFNSEQKNYPAIDLYDYTSRIAIQVTSDSSSTKITETISKFIQKGQYKTFDRLIVYIISEKQKSYNKDFSLITKDLFDFDEKRDIIDNSNLSKIISDIISTAQIEKIRDILAVEFSEKKISERDILLTRKQNIKTESLFLNFVKFTLPEKLYFAIQDLDKEELTSKVKELRKKNKMSFQKGKFFKVNGKNLVEAKLISKEKSVNQDFILFQDKLYTFRDLHLQNEPLREAIDLGTIDYISPSDFFENGENYLYKFKELLRYSFVENFIEKGIEWVGEDKVFRFSAMGVNSSLPKERKVTWTKDTKSQPRTVVLEIMNKKLIQENETRIICFRHLAFFMEIEYYGEWYLSIRPTWCFTNPNNGIFKSRFSSSYLAGLKKQENNQAVLNHFLFIANCIKTNLAETDMNYKSKTSYSLKFNEEVEFKNFSPAINDEDWKPRKSKEKKDNSSELLLNF